MFDHATGLKESVCEINNTEGNKYNSGSHDEGSLADYDKTSDKSYQPTDPHSLFRTFGVSTKKLE